MFAIDLTGAPWCNRVGSRSFWVNGRSSRPWFWQANPLSARLKPEKDCLGAHSGVELLCGYLERLLRSQILLERNMCLLLRRWFLWWSFFFGWMFVLWLVCIALVDAPDDAGWEVLSTSSRKRSSESVAKLLMGWSCLLDGRIVFQDFRLQIVYCDISWFNM